MVASTRPDGEYSEMSESVSSLTFLIIASMRPRSISEKLPASTASASTMAIIELILSDTAAWTLLSLRECMNTTLIISTPASVHICEISRMALIL